MKTYTATQYRMLLVLIGILMGVCIYSCARFEKARTAAFYWQQMYLGDGKGDAQ